MILDGRISGLLKASATENVEGLKGLPAKRRRQDLSLSTLTVAAQIIRWRVDDTASPKPLHLCLPRADWGHNYVVCFCLIPYSLFVFVRCCQFRFFVLWACLLLSDVVSLIIDLVWYHQLLFLLSLTLFVCLICWAPFTCLSFLPSSLPTSLFLTPSLPFSPLPYASRKSQPPGWKER